MNSEMRNTHLDKLSEMTINKDIHPKVCAYQTCKKEFVPKRKWQRFCSPGCKAAFWRELRAEVMREIIMKRKEI